MEVFRLSKAALYAARPRTGVAACDMVCDNVDDDLDTVLVRLCAQSFQVVIGAKLVTDREAVRLIQPVPLGVSVVRLQRRSLYRGKSGFGDVRQLLLDLAKCPVKTV